MELLGRSIIGSRRGETGGAVLHGFNPATGETLEPPYHGATPAEVDQAAQLANTFGASH